MSQARRVPSSSPSCPPAVGAIPSPYPPERLRLEVSGPSYPSLSEHADPRPPPTPPSSASFGSFCPPQAHPSTHTHCPSSAQACDDAVSSPAPAPLPNPNVQNPRPPGALQKKREATYWVRSRRAGSLGGPWGGQRGRGDKKAEQVFFFLHPSQGGVSAGRGSPQGHFPGTTRAQVPSPLLQSAPSPSFPQTGRQGNR